MIVRNKLAQLAILMCMALMGFVVMRHVIHLNMQGMPSVAHLKKISNDVARSLGISQTADFRVLDKTTFLLVERDLVSPSPSSEMARRATQKMRGSGWLDGKARNHNEMTLCKGQIIVDIDMPSGKNTNLGYLGVSWGDAPVRCPSD